MFELTKKECENLRSQFGTSSWGGQRYVPMAFTEQGVAMLSSVLNSKRAIKVNIQIIRVFTRMRKMLLTHQDLFLKIQELEKKYESHDDKIHALFEYFRQLLQEKENPPLPRKRIGYRLKAQSED